MSKPVEDVPWDNEDWDVQSEDEPIYRRSSEGLVVDPDEDLMEEEIRANLSAKITSSAHAYKLAGVALIITLISFTINTVPSFLCNAVDGRNSRSMSSRRYIGRNHTVCCTLPPPKASGR
jgi:hypothetical protein